MNGILTWTGILAASGLLGVILIAGQDSAAQQEAGHGEPVDSITVELCDGETSVSVSKNEPLTAKDGRRIAASLMAEWMRKNPDARWQQETQEVPQAHKIVPPHDNRELLGKGQGKGNTYGNFTARDLLIWARETRKMAAEGAAVFHDAERLGSTIAVSCDMCHPDASNTHPETYPKYQTQLGKTVLLRDMINWCIEHPLRGKKLTPDDPRMRAMEAYILAQRKGTPLIYGKH